MSGETPSSDGRPAAGRQRGQILVLFALGLVTLVGGVALVIDGGVAYAQQRGVQNGSDAAANAGAVVLAQKLGGAPKTDLDVETAVLFSAGQNNITPEAYYTNISGQPIDGSGVAVTPESAALVGDGTIPPGAQGVHVGGTRPFDTTFGRVIGLSTFTAGAEATAVTGRLIGGAFLPVIFPVNITDCAGNGNLGLPKDQWPISQPGSPGQEPMGTEYIVPLCKTGGGSFMVLDLDGTRNNCDDEVTNPPPIQWDTFPVDVASDNGNNCAKKMVDEVNALHGKIVLIPICDNNDCNTTGGSHAEYHVTGVTAFWLDYMSDENNPNNPACQTHTSPSGQLLQTIDGNGSSSCLVGWFIHFITTGPVGSGAIGNGDAIGVQLIK
ncbi:MAG TPA: TadE/TadG family type IV pilus assembly protein [Candidatus Limnocylindrales bacterium]|nr:TadE/TadG family type IV pilus assembly protein [Candidatus Limnocylindrales bacterium]